MDLSDFQTQGMWAPGLDVALSPRHEGRWCGIGVFPAGTLVHITRFQYFQPRNNRAGITRFTNDRQRSERHWRQPGVIARSLDTKFSDADISGVSYVQWLHDLAGIEDDPQTSQSYAMYGVTLFGCFQALTLPVVPNESGALHARLGHLQSLVGLSLADVANRCQRLVRDLLPQEYRAPILKEIDGAHNVIVGSEYETRLYSVIGKMVEGCETTLERLTNHTGICLSEMDKASRDKPGKATADQGDRKVFFLLGQPVPQLSRNVFQNGAQATSTGAPQATGMFKECVECAESIRIAARKCRYCGEAQPTPISERAVVPEQPARMMVPVEEEVVEETEQTDEWLGDEGESIDDVINAESALSDEFTNPPPSGRKVRK